MKPVNILNKLKESEYRYITTHGTGPGTLPKDVNLIKSEDINSNGRIAIYVDRPLTKEELEKYDIKPEWIQESADSGSLECYACGRPTKLKDELNKPICRECYEYVVALVEFGEWIKDTDGVEPTREDFESFRGNWDRYFRTIEYDEIPFDYLEKEAYDIYGMVPPTPINESSEDLKKQGMCPYCTKKLTSNDDWFIQKYGMCQECFENGVE